MRSAGNGKHASCDLGVRCFMQTALRRKTETGNEKDPSAALGMTKRERYISHCFSAHSGNRLLLAFPLGEGGPRQRRSGALVNGALETIPLLSFIPLVPYPARSARHLPHAGKALSVGILFLHVSCICFDDARKAASSYRSLPPWGRGTASAALGCSR